MKKISLIFSTILLIFLVEGCVPAIFVAGAAAGTAAGTVIYDHRNTKTLIADRDITFKIQHRLDHDAELKSGNAHLVVTSFNRIVLLLGQVKEERLKSYAEEIARSNSGVKMLYNEITIEEPISNMARTNDAWLTTKVKARLATTSGLNSSNLKVVTENKVVYLMGLTSRTQATLAADRTRTVVGVAKVVKLFEYLN